MPPPSNLTVVFPVFAADVRRFDFVDEFLAMVKADDAFSRAAVIEAIMKLLAVRGFVLDEEHVFLLTGDIDDHAVPPGLLLHVPNDLGIGLFASELGATICPEL